MYISMNSLFQLQNISTQIVQKRDNTWILKYISICILIFSSNNIFNFLFSDISTEVKSTFDLNLLISTNLLLTHFLKNKFNKLLIQLWIIFYYLGVINIISSILRNNIWDMDIHDGSIYYFINLLIFTCSLIIFERVKPQNIHLKSLTYSIDSNRKVTNSYFTYFILIFPFLFFISFFLSVGFIPLLSGENFVDDMYEYNYGILYGFKLLCVYSFLILIIKIRETHINIWYIIYLVLFLIVISADGKRMMILVCVLSLIPLIENLNSQSKKLKSNFKQSLFIYGTLIFLLLIYMVINGIREGNFSAISVAIYLERIPFGVEYRDYIYSFNNYTPGHIPGYNFEISSIGSLLNSAFLRLFGISKYELIQMGSAYSWMRLEHSEFGIRTGIISELYFAYGYWGMLVMIVIGFLTSRVTHAIANTKTYFGLIQNCIMYTLIVMLIVGQTTELFGNLTLMFYTWILFKLSPY